MRLAIELAANCTSSADVPVGALVLNPAGAVLGSGWNRREAQADPTAHAEIVALRQAAGRSGTWRLAGCTLVVTLEPCAMCAGAAVQARLARVVFGAFDARAGAVGSLWDVVRDPRINHRPEVVSGVLAEQCADLLQEFFAGQRHNAPVSAVADRRVRP